MIVVGDLGGHWPVLQRVVDAIPDGESVIQVGDMIRISAARRRDNLHIARWMLTNSDRVGWVQLLGNHEAAALGGSARPYWDVEGSMDPEAIEILAWLWNSGCFQLAAAVERPAGTPVLVTHAGLTRGRWIEAGAPRTAVEARLALQRHMCEPMGRWERPGSLVLGGPPNTAADEVWAEVNEELYVPWLDSADMPFDQIHGHASPYRWPKGDWWPETPADVRRATSLDVRARSSTTRLGHHVAISVDWGLGDADTAETWPLLELRDSSVIPPVGEE